jgi:peptide deformylase
MTVRLVPADTPLLHRPAARLTAPVPDVLLLAMTDLVADQRALGLAAPQVGLDRHAFVVHHPRHLPPQWFANTQIERHADASDVVDLEGCLSLPGELVPVERPDRIWVTFVRPWAPDATPERREFTGMAARVIQHEHDHCQGVLISDRAVALTS